MSLFILLLPCILCFARPFFPFVIPPLFSIISPVFIPFFSSPLFIPFSSFLSPLFAIMTLLSPFFFLNFFFSSSHAHHSSPIHAPLYSILVLLPFHPLFIAALLTLHLIFFSSHIKSTYLYLSISTYSL